MMNQVLTSKTVMDKLNNVYDISNCNIVNIHDIKGYSYEVSDNGVWYQYIYDVVVSEIEDDPGKTNYELSVECYELRNGEYLVVIDYEYIFLHAGYVNVFYVNTLTEDCTKVVSYDYDDEN